MNFSKKWKVGNVPERERIEGGFDVGEEPCLLLPPIGFIRGVHSTSLAERER